MPVIELENRALLALVWMSCAGVGFDHQAWETLAEESAAEVARWLTQLEQLAPGQKHLFGRESRNWNSGADGLKVALTLLWQRRSELPSAVPILAIHDEIVIECAESDVPQAQAWLVQAMKDGMQPFADPVPVEVEATISQSWGG